MKILMLGWEYPPAISGGLGIASQGLAEALVEAGHSVTFLLPKLPTRHQNGSVSLIDASALKPDIRRWTEEHTEFDTVRYLELGSRLIPYLGWEHFEQHVEKQVGRKVITHKESIKLLEKIKLTGTYGPDLMDEIAKFALLAVQIASQDSYNLVHCHDWMTFKAGEAVQQQLGVPFFAHFHSVEAERNGFHAHPQIKAIEQTAAKCAKQVIAVSQSTGMNVLREYQVSKNQVATLPNGFNKRRKTPKHPHSKKLIGFVGRFTDQKNPRKFLELARLLSSEREDINFVMIGDGHQMEDIRNQIHAYNLESRVRLTGFIPHEKALTEIDQMDALLVTSNAEPFGLVPLEAIRSHIPVITTQGCGLADFIPSLKQISHWDTFGWTKEIDHLLDDEHYRSAYTRSCFHESEELTWAKAAEKATQLYHQAITLQHD